MAIRIHHTQQKQADRLGITLVKGDMDITASKDNKSASGPSAGLAIASLLKILGASTADVMGAIKKNAAPKAAKPKKTKKTKKAKLKCEACGSTDLSSDEEGGYVCEACGETVEDPDAEDGKSVVKKKYKVRYKPTKNSCGDTIANDVRAYVQYKDETTKKMVTDVDKLVKFAKANGCWDPNYQGLNNGMVRMNVINRLRGKIRRDKHEIVWP